MKLTLMGKIVFTIVTIILSIIVVHIACYIGNTGSESNAILVVGVLSWFWLLFGQFVILAHIWK